MKRPTPPVPSAPYRIRTVAELTGVAAPTLRAWERRYGVPAPPRAASAYRLYGPAELSEIERMRDLCGQGVAASQAAAMVTLERTGRESAAIRADETSRPQAVGRLVQATARLDGPAIDRELALATDHDSLLGAFEGVLKPALEQIGELWARGELSVGHEHFASERVGSFLLSSLRSLNPDGHARSVLLACFDKEQHEIPLLGLALRFALWGFRPVLLGGRTPPDAVEATVATARPSLVALSITIAPEARQAATLVRAYAGAIGDTPWIVGGASVEKIAPAVRRAGGIVVLEPLSQLHKSLRGAIRRSSAPIPPWGDRR